MKSGDFYLETLASKLLELVNSLSLHRAHQAEPRISNNFSHTFYMVYGVPGGDVLHLLDQQPGQQLPVSWVVE